MTLQECQALLCALQGLLLGAFAAGRHGWIAGLAGALGGATAGLAFGHGQQEASNALEQIARRVSQKSRAIGLLLHGLDALLILLFVAVLVGTTFVLVSMTRPGW